MNQTTKDKVNPFDTGGKGSNPFGSGGGEVKTTTTAPTVFGMGALLGDPKMNLFSGANTPV